MKKWTIEDSKELYNINGWGTSFFGVNDKGDVYVSPCKDNTEIDLRDVMDELALRDVYVASTAALSRHPRQSNRENSQLFRQAARNTVTKAKTLLSIPSRLTKCNPW